MSMARAMQCSPATARTGACRLPFRRASFASRALQSSRSMLFQCRAGGDATGFLDLANLVSGGGGAKTPYDELAGKIGSQEPCIVEAATRTGKEVYVDVNGWHLYLRDISVPGANAKLSQAVAAHLGSKAKGGLSKDDVEAALKKVPFKLGGGKTQLSLFDVVPNYAVQELQQILQDYARNS